MQTGLTVPDIGQCLHLFFLRAMQMGLIVPDCGQYFRFLIISPSYQALRWIVPKASDDWLLARLKQSVRDIYIIRYNLEVLLSPKTGQIHQSDAYFVEIE